MNWAAIRKAIYDWTVAGSGLNGQKVVWGRQPGTPRPAAPAIIMEISGVENDGAMWTELRAPCTPLTFDHQILDVNGSNLVILNHGLETGDGPALIESDDTLPTPLVAGKHYWVIKVDDDTIRLADSYVKTGGGHPDNPVTHVPLTSTGSGAITLTNTHETVRAGQELHYAQVSTVRLTLTLTSYTSQDVGEDDCMALLYRVVSRARLPSQAERLEGVNFGFQGADRVRTTPGARDAVLFEPRAWVDIALTTTLTETEYVTIIERIQAENLNTGQIYNIPEE